ncbi:MAG TPA: hypothetical protein VMH88_12130 [Gemmatimonadales bacterium]|nr:hypothetical protein [Gemmatimonadales bacterium]
MRPDEQFAQRAFHTFLANLGHSVIDWTPGNEPPDLLLTVDDQPFAVEITRVMEVISLGETSMPDQGVNQALLRFAEEIEGEAKEKAALTGNYIFYLEPIPDMANHRSRLKELAFAFFRRTATVDSAKPEMLASFDNGATIHIEKASASGSKLIAITGSADAKWGGQVIRDVSTLIQSAVLRKADKLSSLQLAKILLLIDEYSYGTSEEWQAAANWLRPHPFHTIVRVHEGAQCQVLFTRAARWRIAAA